MFRFSFPFHLFLSILSLYFLNLFSLETGDGNRPVLLSTTIPRNDESWMELYLSPPKNGEPFPLVVLVQGSDSESVIGNHETLANRFFFQGIGILSMEKRGISVQGVDVQEFREHDRFEERVEDFSTLLKAIEEGLVPGWNGKLVLLSGSEGGKIAPRMALKFPKTVDAVVLIGSGGGMPFGEELKFQIEVALSRLNPLYKACLKLYNLIIPQEVDDQYAKILKQPDSLELWHHKTFRWWASYLRYDPLPEILQLSVPVYMIHGALDPKIPVESADALKAAFDEANNHSLTYARYDDLEHSLKGREDVYLPLVEWIKRVLLVESPASSAVIKENTGKDALSLEALAE